MAIDLQKTLNNIRKKQGTYIPSTGKGDKIDLNKTLENVRAKGAAELEQRQAQRAKETAIRNRNTANAMEQAMYLQQRQNPQAFALTPQAASTQRKQTASYPRLSIGERVGQTLAGLQEGAKTPALLDSSSFAGAAEANSPKQILQNRIDELKQKGQRTDENGVKFYQTEQGEKELRAAQDVLARAFYKLTGQYVKINSTDDAEKLLSRLPEVTWGRWAEIDANAGRTMQAVEDRRDAEQRGAVDEYYKKYGSLMEREDFAEKSKYKSTATGEGKYNYLLGAYDSTGFEDILYDYINKNETAATRQYINDLASSLPAMGLDQSFLQTMTPAEVRIYNYLYATEGRESANEYVKYIRNTLTQRQRQETQEWFRQYAQENPVMASAFSALQSPLKGLSYLGQAQDLMLDGTIDQNAAYNKFADVPNVIRQTVAENWGPTGSFLYQTGMSMADFLVTLGVTGGSNLSLAIMGSGAAADTVIDAKDRGLSDVQAFTLGTVAGAAEAMTERLSIESLMDMATLSKGAVAYIVKNALTEAGEEAASGIVNALTDILVSRDKSQWQQEVNRYYAQGMTKKQAVNLALMNQAKSIGLDALGGALSGGVMAGGAAGISAANNAVQNRVNAAEQQYAPMVGAMQLNSAWQDMMAEQEAQKAQPQQVQPQEEFEQGAEQAVQSDAQAAPQMQTEAVQTNEQSVDIKQEALNNEQTEILSGRGPQRGLAPIDAGSAGQMERAGTAAAARRNQQQIAQRRTSVAEQNGLRRVSSRELGLGTGTDLRRNVVLEDESLWDDELRSIKKNWDDMNRRRREKYGYTQDMELKFVLGKMQVRDADGADVLVDGVVNDDGSVCVCVNSMTRSATEIAEHEFFHTLEAETPDLVDALWPAVESVGLNDAMVQRYRRFYSETLGYSERMVRAEILADAYAGLERIQGTEMQTVKDMVRQLTGEAQEAIERGWYTPAAEETYESVDGEGRETRGPPMYSAEEDEIAALNAQLYAMNAEYRELEARDNEFKNAPAYVNLMDAISGAREEKKSLLDRPEALDRALEEYRAWQDESGYTAVIQRMEELRGEMKTLQRKIDRAEEEAARKAKEEYRANYTEEMAKEYASKAARKFGTTSRFDLAGYLTVNGSLLNFSAGQGYRVQDHREVAEVLDFLPENHGYSDGMIEFMNMGNIRLQSYGIDIAKAPNAAQKTKLKTFFRNLGGEVTVDFSDVNGNTLDSVDYDEGTRPERILSDIDEFFKTGEVRRQSDVARFHNMYSVSDEVDSEGNELSVEQAEFFADSKVRDEDGNLMVMYHGTPNAGFTVFRSGSYFTPNREYAEGYRDPNASMLTRKRTAVSPDTYAVYLNITKPFDTRNDTEREIFENEFYRQWGTGTPLADSGLPDWVDGMDLQEFIEEMGYDYDGLILDEGGTGGYGEEVRSRGLSYVAFSPEQVKNIDNRTPTSDPDIRYSVSDEEDGKYAPTFYSHMERVIENTKQEKLGAASVVSMLKGKGVKNEEIKWSGIETFLEGKKSVTKQELLEFMQGNRLQIEEVTLGEPSYTQKEQDMLNQANEDYENTAEMIDGMWEELFGEGIPAEVWASDVPARKLEHEAREKIQEYLRNNFEALGDAEFYNRFIEKRDRIMNLIASLQNVEDIRDAIVDEATERTGAQWSDYATPGGARYREYLFKMPGSEYTNLAMEGHWKRGGVLAHARVQDFDHEDGTVLFIEEIQSDWHNAGQKHGYRLEGQKDAGTIRKESEEAYNEFYGTVEKFVFENSDWMDDNATFYAHPVVVAEMFEGDESQFDKLKFDESQRNTIRKMVAEEKARRELLKTAPEAGSAPDAPYEKTYHEFVLKNLLRKAAEGGYAYLAWTPGWMQEERWSSEFAEGYRIEYDQDIPKFLNKYGKQWGAKTGEIWIGGDGTYSDIKKASVDVEMDADIFEGEEGNYVFTLVYDGKETFVSYTEEELADEGVDTSDENAVLKHLWKDYAGDDASKSVHAIPITDAMRKSVLYEGQPMYSVSDEQETTERPRRDLTPGQELTRKEHTLIKRAINQSKMQLRDIVPAGTKEAREVQQMQILDLAQKLWETGEITQENIDDAFEEIWLKGATVDRELADQYAELRAALRTGVSVSEDLKKEITDYGQFRRANFGSFTMRSGQQSDVDIVYQELSGQYPSFFPENITEPADQLQQMADVAQRLKPVVRTMSEQYNGNVDAKAGMKADFVDLVRNMELEILHPVQEVTKKQKDQKEAERVASYRQIYKEVMDEVFKVQQRETYEPDPEYWHEVADDAWGRMNERAEAIQGEWLRSLTKEGFKGAESLNELGVKIAGSVADYHLIDQILENHRAAQSVRKDIRKAERKLKATSKEKNYAAGIASGVFTEADISGDARPHVVMELADYYMMERIVGLDLIEARRNDMYAEVDYQVESLMQDKDAYKVSSSPVLFYRTPQRNMINMYGREHGQKVYDFLFAPVAENEAERIRWVNRMHDEVRLVEGENGKKKPLNRKERALVQMVMEGRAVAEVVAAMEEREVIYDAAANLRNGQDIEDIVRQFNLNQEMRNAATDYATWLDTNDILQTTKGVDQKRINNAVELYAKQYNRFYKAINDFLAAHGYEPIGFIKGYAPHIQPEATRNLLQSTLKMMGLSEGVTELPAAIAGRTHVYRPNKRWNPYFMSRHGDQTEYDVTAGYESYVDYLSDILYHTDDTVRIRRAANYFRRTYAPEEISNNLSWAEGLRNASPEQKAEMLREQNKLKYTETPSAAAIGELFDKYVDELYDSIKDQSKYSNFVNWLEDYANQLTGKQSLADRGMEVLTGRQSLNFANKLNRAFQRANVAGNMSTVLNQTAQLPMIVADIGNVNTLLALKDYAVGKVRRDGFKEKSDFLTARKGMNNLVVDPTDRVINIMFTPAQVADELVSTIAARGAYIKAVRQGMSDAEAMRYADRKAEQIMGSRAKGSAPQAFRSKNPLVRMVNMFQVEALNAFEYVEQDLIIQGIKDIKQIDDGKGRATATAALIGLLGKMLVAAFLWNRTTEELYGGSPAQFDLLGYAANFLASGNGLTANQQLLDWIDMAWERAFGEPLFDIDPDYNEEFDWKNATSDLGYAVISDVPLVRNLAGLFGVGDQSLPMPDMSKVYDAGKSLWDNGASLETLDAALAAVGQFVPGGRQINKTYQGARTMAKGGRYYGYGENQRLQYPVENSAGNWVKALLFGPSGLSENTEFYAAGGDDGLSAGTTRKYQELMQVGMTSEMALETYEEYRRINRLEDLTAAEKATEFAKWLANMEVPADQAQLAREAFMFWGMVPGEATKYDTFVGEGLEADDAYALTEALGALEPEEGETTVSNLQRYRAVLDHTTDEAVRYAALAGVMQDKEFARLRAAYDYVQSGTYVEFLTAFDEAYPGETKSQERVETVLRQMRLDAEERAALWQMCGPKWKTDNNPFSKSVGREVAGLIEEYYAEIDGE